MNPETRFDIIIAGAGAAGLTLLWYIINSEQLNKKRVLILDQSFDTVNDKTWCFWEDNNLNLDEFIYHRWGELEVGALGNFFSERLHKYSYECIRNGDYSKKIRDLAASFQNLVFKKTVIQGFSHTGEFGTAITEDGTFSAPSIFQSVLPPTESDTAKSDISLLQHFVGWEIEVKTDLFNPDKAIFMDFNVPRQNGLTFLYVLPFSANRALVEYTLFSKKLLPREVYEKGISEYLAEKYGLDEHRYSIIRKEMGAIPMEDRRYDSWYCNRVMNVGVAGGLTKPTTGYTFTRIHQRCKEIVKALENDTELSAKPISSYRFRVYDMMMLYLLDSDVEVSVKIFHDLFKNNDFDRVLQFLEEKTNPFQEVAIFSSLPYAPFFKSIYKMKHRILTGA